MDFIISVFTKKAIFVTSTNYNDFLMEERNRTLGEFIIENQSEFAYSTGELSKLLNGIRLAAKMVNYKSPMPCVSKRWMGVCWRIAFPADGLIVDRSTDSSMRPIFATSVFTRMDSKSG